MSACAGGSALAEGVRTTAGADSATSSSAAESTTTTTLPAVSTTATTLPATTTSSVEEVSPETTTTTAPRDITVAIAGDVLSNKGILLSLYRSGADSYDYVPIFAPIAPYLRAADYTIVNLETRLAGPERGYSSFPRFNAPDSVAGALKGAGVDMVANANNHALDMGWEGLARTLDVVEAAGLDSIGAYRSQAERDTPHIVEVGGINLCFLSYTSLTNGLPVPKDRPYALALLDPDVVATDAAKARTAGADLVVAILHWGVEYQRQPNSGIRTLAEKLLRDCGVDVIVGGHPHVVEPIEKVAVPGSVTGEKYVVYSVGNFMSSMVTRYSDCGIVVYLHIEKLEGATWVKDIQYLPVYMMRGPSDGRRSYRVLPDLSGLDPVSDLPLTARDRAKLDEIWRDTSTMLEDPSIGVTALAPD